MIGSCGAGFFSGAKGLRRIAGAGNLIHGWKWSEIILGLHQPAIASRLFETDKMFEAGV